MAAYNAAMAGFDTLQMPSARWERGTRYYEAHLQRDLFGTWVVIRIWGRKATPRGQVRTDPVGSESDGWEVLRQVAGRRRRRGYRLVRAWGETAASRAAASRSPP